MKISKLKKLKQWILAEPRRYYQNVWVANKENPITQQQNPPCGTVGCLAGNACLMEGHIKRIDGIGNAFDKNGNCVYCPKLAQQILGLTRQTAEWLFDVSGNGWSTEAKIAYDNATTLEGRAQAAAMELDRLIKQGSRKSKSKSKSKTK
jgi:hypothetical protein